MKKELLKLIQKASDHLDELDELQNEAGNLIDPIDVAEQEGYIRGLVISLAIIQASKT